MPTESVVFIILSALVFAGIISIVIKLLAKVKSENRINEAAVKAFDAQQNTPEGKQQAAEAAIVDVKATALGGIEADEAAGRTPRMTGSRVATYRRNMRREISVRRTRADKKAARKAADRGA
jgi:hypothetical protein